MTRLKALLKKKRLRLLLIINKLNKKELDAYTELFFLCHTENALTYDTVQRNRAKCGST